MDPMLVLADIPDEAVALTAIGGSFVIAIIAIIGGFIKSFSETKEREKTRREVAAYVAEGTMTTDDAERILRVGPSGKNSAST